MSTARSLAERTTKSLVLASTGGTIAAAALYTSLTLPHYFLVAVIVGAVSFAIGRRWPERLVGALLAVGCVAPVLFLAAYGYRYYYLSLWEAALFGGMLATAGSRWHLPPRLHTPLLLWALAIAVTWPLGALRVVDWHPTIWWRAPAVPMHAVHAIEPGVFVAQMACGHLLGIVAIDWLCNRFTGRDVWRFAARLMQPAVIAVTGGALLTLYQGLFDLHVLSIGSWPDIGRASGLLADGNASGALLALFVGVTVGFAISAERLSRAVMWAGTAVVLVAATYVTGSRTAMLCALFGMAAAGHAAVVDGRLRRRILPLIALTAVCLAAALAVVPGTISNPLRRISEVLPSYSMEGARSAAIRLWTREGYGTAALGMIADHPLEGVGIGVYHSLASNYSYEMQHVALDFDNAQNWFRHQLAELGVLGSLGWIWWSGILMAAAFTAPRVPRDRPMALGLKYTIAGFAAASMLGMPAQNLIVSLVFWMLAFWMLLLAGTAGEAAPGASGRSTWFAVMVALVFSGITAYAGTHDLRPPYLARRFDYYYADGLYDPMLEPAGRTQTGRRAAVALATPSRTLVLTAAVEHPDADARPVHVRIWIDGAMVIDSRFPRATPLTREVAVPGGHQRVVLETAVDRTFADPDSRRAEVGVTLEWRFADAP